MECTHKFFTATNISNISFISLPWVKISTIETLHLFKQDLCHIIFETSTIT
jgi:hypothetical protein